MIILYSLFYAMRDKTNCTKSYGQLLPRKGGGHEFFGLKLVSVYMTFEISRVDSFLIVQLIDVVFKYKYPCFENLL